MFSPTLSNRGKTAFIVGVVITVSLFCLLIGSKTSTKEMELHEGVDLLSPPLPKGLEDKMENAIISMGTADIDVSNWCAPIKMLRVVQYCLLS